MVKEGYSKINPVKFALASATIFAAFILILTLIAIIEPFGHHPQIASLFSAVYGGIGYSVTYLGALIGAAYVFIDTFILIWVFAWLYNKLID